MFELDLHLSRSWFPQAANSVTLSSDVKRRCPICGVAGFIGQPKRPDVSFQIATKLFEKSEIRGKDASGFWGTESGDEGSVIFHKEPVASGKLVDRDIWAKTVAKLNINLLIMHARHASAGSDPKWNKNNHPFTSNDRSIAMVHNGKLPESPDIRKRYETKTDTDSEVLLRIFEWAAANTPQEVSQAELPGYSLEIASRVLGLKEIYSHVQQGLMAVAFGERLHDARNLWLFRNEDRPIHVVDARETLGQIFFCSTYEIWRNAIRECPNAKPFVANLPVIVMPSDQIWHFGIDKNNLTPSDDTCNKFDIRRKATWSSFEECGQKLPIIKCLSPFSIISYLNENDEFDTTDIPQIAYKKRGKKAKREAGNRTWDLPAMKEGGNWPHRYDERIENFGTRKHEVPMVNEIRPAFRINDSDDSEDNQVGGFDLPGLSDVIQDMRSMASDIQTQIENKIMEGSLTMSEFQQCMEDLQSTLHDLQGTMAIAEGR